jgi:hypothetical protein
MRRPALVSPGIYWIGGSPCAGKSTVAEALAAGMGCRYYKCDDHFGEHLKRGADLGWPWSAKVLRAKTDDIFLGTLRENVELALGLYREHFRLIAEDVLGGDGPVVVEGAQLQPRCLHDLGVDATRAFHLIPTEAFQRFHYARRTWAPERVADSRDPARALENWMARDVEYARTMAAEAEEVGQPRLWVDGSLTVEETIARVGRHFGLVNLPA